MVKVTRRRRWRPGGGGWINCQRGFGGSEVKLPTQRNATQDNYTQNLPLRTALLISSERRGRTSLGLRALVSPDTLAAQARTLRSWFGSAKFSYIGQKVAMKMLIGFQMIEAGPNVLIQLGQFGPVQTHSDHPDPVQTHSDPFWSLD